nr:immunoglobulin heavy chain junction region [Mus musculus]
CARGRGYYDYW